MATFVGVKEPKERKHEKETDKDRGDLLLFRPAGKPLVTKYKQNAMHVIGAVSQRFDHPKSMDLLESVELGFGETKETADNIVYLLLKSLREYRWKDAVLLLKSLQGIHQTHMNVIFRGLLTVYEGMNQFSMMEDMLAFVKSAVILDPTNAEEAVFATIQILIRGNRYKDAHIFLETYISLAPFSTNGLLNGYFGWLHYREWASLIAENFRFDRTKVEIVAWFHDRDPTMKEIFDNAVKYFNNALTFTKEPQVFQFALCLSQLYLLNNDISSCHSLWSQYSTANPDDPNGWKQYALFLGQHFPTNVQDYAKALFRWNDLDPMADFCFEELIRMSSDDLISINKAIDLIVVRISHALFDESLWRLLAEAFYKKRTMQLDDDNWKHPYFNEKWWITQCFDQNVELIEERKEFILYKWICAFDSIDHNDSNYCEVMLQKFKTEGWLEDAIKFFQHFGIDVQS